MTDDKTQALVAAQICREMEQAEESARLGKRPTGETWTARHSKDTREVREEEIAVVNAEVEGSYSATDSTNSTLVEANKRNGIKLPSHRSSLWGHEQVRPNACPYTCPPNHKAILRQVAINLSRTNKYFNQMASELLAAIQELWILDGGGSLEAAADLVIQDVLNRGPAFNNLEKVDHQTACAMWLLQCIRAGIYHPATDQCGHERVSGFSVLELWALPFSVNGARV